MIDPAARGVEWEGRTRLVTWPSDLRVTTCWIVYIIDKANRSMGYWCPFRYFVSLILRDERNADRARTDLHFLDVHQ